MEFLLLVVLSVLDLLPDGKSSRSSASSSAFGISPDGKSAAAMFSVASGIAPGGESPVKTASDESGISPDDAEAGSTCTIVRCRS